MNMDSMGHLRREQQPIYKRPPHRGLPDEVRIDLPVPPPLPGKKEGPTIEKGNEIDITSKDDSGYVDYGEMDIGGKPI